MNIRILLLLPLLLGVSINGWTAPAKCVANDTLPGCKPGDGGDIVYTAELTAGGFVFNPGPSVEVTPNTKENELRSETNLEMQRPDTDGSAEQSAWDTVFSACQLLSFPVAAFDAPSGDWKITNFDQPRVAFANILLDGARVTIQLIGDGISSDPFLPEPGDTSTFTLTKFAITGRSVRGAGGPSRSCSPRGQQINDMAQYSTLEITASSPE